jgi:hypothetical protein
MLGSALVNSPVVAYLFLCLAGLGMNSGNSLFWSLNASFMTGIAAAVSIAAVNMIAQFGGLIGPWLIGLVKGVTGNFFRCLSSRCRILVPRCNYGCQHESDTKAKPWLRAAAAIIRVERPGHTGHRTCSRVPEGPTRRGNR